MVRQMTDRQIDSRAMVAMNYQKLDKRWLRDSAYTTVIEKDDKEQHQEIERQIGDRQIVLWQQLETRQEMTAVFRGNRNGAA